MRTPLRMTEVNFLRCLLGFLLLLLRDLNEGRTVGGL